MQIVHKQGSLFDAPPGILAHGCNGMGVWGSGIAKEFKLRFPRSFTQYHNWCNDLKFNDENPRGLSLLTTPETNYRIGCLVTSLGYGPTVDDPDVIIKYTEYAVDDLLLQATELGCSVINSNQFNSGLFNVPWNQTEEVLKDVLKAYKHITWNVWTP